MSSTKDTIKREGYRSSRYLGDLSVTHDAHVGRNAHVQGNAHIQGNARIDGWLDAPNLKTVNKGLFASLELLNQTYPNPKAGWYALVGNTIPADVYVAIDGEWVPTGEKSGGIEIDITGFVPLGDDGKISHEYIPTIVETFKCVDTSYFIPYIVNYRDFEQLQLLSDREVVFSSRKKSFWLRRFVGKDNVSASPEGYVYLNPNYWNEFEKYNDSSFRPYSSKFYYNSSTQQIFFWNGTALIATGLSVATPDEVIAFINNIK